MLAALSFLVAVALLIWNLKFKKHTPDHLFVNRVVLPEKKSRKKKGAQAEASQEAKPDATEESSAPAEESEASQETPSEEPTTNNEITQQDNED
jgi:hypothetical protein